MNYFLKKIFLLAVMGWIAIGMNSCEFSESGMMRSTGAINELLVITENKALWEGAFGDTLRSVFSREMVGLPQPEPMFDAINIASKDLGDLYKRFHNIFIAQINPQLKNPELIIQKNAWAEPQRVIILSAPDEASFFMEFKAQKDNILAVFIALERERTPILSEMANDFDLTAAISSEFGISLAIPGGFYIAQDSPDFMWLRHKEVKSRSEVELGILIYSMDYKDTAIFNPNKVISWRNLITREYVPGPSQGSYMKVSQDFIPPVFTAMSDFSGGYALETRGIWEVENDYMGGAFISYTFVNTKTNKVITMDGYVYNPNNDKKNYIRHLESIFWGMRY